MSRKLPKNGVPNSKDDNSQDENEDLQQAIKEMVKTPDIEERPGTSSKRSDVQCDSRDLDKHKPFSKVIQKSQVEQESQTGEPCEKPRKSKHKHSKLDSEDSWSTLLIQRFTWTNKTQTTDVVLPESVQINTDTINETQPSTTEPFKCVKAKSTEKINSSTDTSNESLIRTDHYGQSNEGQKENAYDGSPLVDEGSNEESVEFLEKLRKIEEASKPKTWRRPTPIVIKPKEASSTTKKKDEVEATLPTSTEKHRYINILKVPLHRNLNYATQDESKRNPDQPPGDNDPSHSNRPTESPEKELSNSEGTSDQKPEEVPEKKQEEPTADQSAEKNRRNTDSQRTLTITGHSHVTTKLDKHCHFKEQESGVDKPARRKLIVACILCLVFMIIEAVGGFVSNSLAIATDAAHLLTDLSSFLISLFALHLAGRPASERLNFGWYRAEVIGAMISVFFIWVLTGILVYMAIMRWVNQDFELDAVVMLITSALAIAFNLIMAVQLHFDNLHFVPGKFKRSKVVGSETGSEVGLSMVGRSVSTQLPVKEEQNINVRAALIHVIGDLIQSVGVFVAALIIFFLPAWAFMDSVCTLFFSVLVIVVTIKILKDVLMVLMEATPDFMDYEEVKRTFLSIPGVEHVHNLRIWALSINKVALSAHLAISKDADPQLILEEATKLIHKRFRFFETTIQIEEYSPDMENCEQCSSPADKNERRKSADLEKGAADADPKKMQMQQPADSENG
ncbi:zinc transporter 4 isoform X1 [Drosophila biarmipes]|uniref:zinc transporter 4 isoform X1 n=2 Tax=Drosophila biarmipes TaxID=125945 RepID=UPI0007E7A283|nr:zinc transporter 4 isoform X1 [Drosophila biarmipes]